MRDDLPVFAAENRASTKRPRFVIRIGYDVESIYLTSHAGITGVPGVVIENCLKRPSAISQRIVPDEGRAEIGSFSFSLVDVASAFTQEMRDKLGDGKGLRGKTVSLYVGYEHEFEEEGGGFGTWGPSFGYGTGSAFQAKFSEFRLFQTQIVVDASYDKGVYTIDCEDITREQRKDIFEPKKTTLRDTISAAADVVPVYSTVGFQPVWHGASYSDGPNQKVGYVKIDKEIIRYTGLTTDSFTGCTRGVLNTRAVQHEVDASSDAERRPAVEECIYLELPAVKLCYAVLTGIILGTSPTQTLPPHWHLGIDTDFVRLSDFENIGVDLWDPALDTEGFIADFVGLKKTDGKKFIETELYMLLGCYSPIYADGTIGLRRMNQVLADAAYVAVLDARNVSSHGPLNHEFTRMHNRLRIDWNWNGERFTRSTLFIDADSIATHGPAPLKRLQFRGLSGRRHTEAIIRKRLDAFRDRFSSPPESAEVDLLPGMNVLEIGDVVRDQMRHVRDWNGTTQDIDRSFEVQRATIDWSSGLVKLDLFGSTAPASTQQPNDTGAANALPDAFYNSEGTNLASVCTIVVTGGVGEVQPGTYDLPAGIYYYLGDLTIADGATFTINATVQIRVRGFLTINGDIDGVGRGKAGQADVAEVDTTVPGLPGFLGASRGMDGVSTSLRVRGLGVFLSFFTEAPAFTNGQYAAVPYFELVVDGNSLLGLPTDLAGTSGGAGGKLVLDSNASETIVRSLLAVGGTGANSGAGLILISRGVSFGASAEIDLSGEDSVATSPVNLEIGGYSAYPGAGGAGCPGSLLILLDGSSVSVPDLGGKFFAVTGSVPVNGTPLEKRGPVGQTPTPVAGYLDESMISAVDLSNVAYRVQYIPAAETPQEDQNLKPAAPTGLTVTPNNGFNRIAWTNPPPDQYDEIEIYASITNNRPDAVKVGSVRATSFSHNLPNGGLYYYWIRARRDLPGLDVFSDWLPFDPTGGTRAIAATAVKFATRSNMRVFGSVAQKIGGSAAWDSEFHSLESFPVVHIAWKPSQTNAKIFVGLSANPLTDEDFDTIDYALFTDDDGNMAVYESGVIDGGVSAYTTDTELAITYNSATGELRYLKDRIELAESKTVATGLSLYADSSFFTAGGAIDSLRFGPSTVLDAISTPQLTPNAATELYFATDDGPEDVTSIATGGTVGGSFCEITYTPIEDTDATLTVVASVTLDPDAISVDTSGFIGAFASKTGPLVVQSDGLSVVSSGIGAGENKAYSAQLQFSMLKDVEYTIGLFLNVNDNGLSDSTIRLEDMYAAVEIIKR